MNHRSRFLFHSLLVAFALGCKKEPRSLKTRDGAGTMNDLVVEAEDRASASPIVSHSQTGDCSTEDPLRCFFDQFGKDFTKGGVTNLLAEVSSVIKAMDQGEMRERIFIKCNDHVWNLTMPRLAEIERIDGSTEDSLEKVSEEFDVIYLLVEGIWNLGAQPFVLYPVSINDYELSRIDYARHEAERWRKIGRVDLARIHELMAARLIAIVEDPDGSVRKSFQLFCRSVDDQSRGMTLSGSRAYDIKFEMLERIRKHVGRHPRWAEEWIDKNAPL